MRSKRQKDAWKEKFLLQMKDEAVPVKTFADDNEYHIWGFHFFNKDNRMKEFDEGMAVLVNEAFDYKQLEIPVQMVVKKPTPYGKSREKDD